MRLLISIVYAALGWVTVAHQNCDSDDPQSYDGSCNNLQDPSQGAAFTFYRRGAEGAKYADDISLKVTDRPNERVISNKVSQDIPGLLDAVPHNMLAVLFGQFVNHDFENNDKKGLFVTKFENPFVLSRDIEITDPNDFFCFFHPPPSFEEEYRCNPHDPGPPFYPLFIEFRPSNGMIINDQYEVLNRGTSYLDLHTIYGADIETASALRTKHRGMLLSEDYSGDAVLFGNQLPYDFRDLPPSRNTTGLETDTLNLLSLSDEEILTAGDFRVNENIGLTLMHILFLREHNRLALEMFEEDSTLSDEELYQQARRRNIAQYQNIVMYEYAPKEFGSYFANRLGSYPGYTSSTDASTGAVFAAAAFRYGHSAIRSYPPVDRCGNAGTVFPFLMDLPNIGQTGGPFTPFAVAALAGGFEPVIRGLIAARTKPIDVSFDDGIRNIIFPLLIDGGAGIDLMALDIQRGRDNGIPNYACLRRAYRQDADSRIYENESFECGSSGTSSTNSGSTTSADHTSGSASSGSGNDAPRCIDRNDKDDSIQCFLKVTAAIPDDPNAEEEDLALALKQLYGKVKRIDAIIGLLAEPPVPGTSFGQTIGTIIIDQYKRARSGDRFWFENSNLFSEDELGEVRSVTMKTLLERNFDLENLPEDVFLAPHNFNTDLAAGCS